MLLVSGTKARVGSRGVEKEGLEISKVRSIEDEFERSNPDKSVPDKVYRLQRPRPLLLVYVLSESDSTSLSNSDGITALGLSVPKFDDADVAKRVIYRVNLVEWKSMLEEELDDDFQEEDDR